MNCAKCPHMKAIERALRPCQSCDAGRLHGQIGITQQTVDWAMAQRRIDDHTPSDGVTALPPDTEDALRKVLATLVQLEPMELLLVQHVMRGGSYASFAEPLYGILRRLRTKEAELSGRRGGFRSLAQTWAQKVMARLPVLASVFPSRVNGDP